MIRPTFDLDVLRTFVTGIELGSFARAADRLGRSTSAVSAQLKKLEDAVGAPVLRKVGRGMAMTPAGELLFGYAQRLLALDHEAADAVRGTELDGSIRLGLQEDFGEGLLTDVLAGFARAHPRVRVQVRLARNAELMRQMEAGQADLVLAWRRGGRRPAQAHALARVPLCWIGVDNDMTEASASEPLPLAMLEGPCLMREAATAALDRARIPWRIAFTSASLAGVWAAVGAGLGVTVRTAIGIPPRLKVLGRMPKLPQIELDLHRAATRSAAVARLENLLAEHVRALA